MEDFGLTYGLHVGVCMCAEVSKHLRLVDYTARLSEAPAISGRVDEALLHRPSASSASYRISERSKAARAALGV